MLQFGYEDLEEVERSARKTNLRPPLTIQEWRDRNLPEPDFLMGDWITTTSRILDVAPTGIGKTNLIIPLGMAVAAGMDFLHWRGRRTSKVLYVDGEMSRRLLKQRILDAARRLGAEPSGFHALSHEDFSNFQPLNTQEGQEQIESIFTEIGPVDLVMFDSVMCLTIGDMKEEGPWNQIMPWVRSLTQRRIGQIWVNHTGHDETRQYGTKTREWQMDTVLFQQPAKRDGIDMCFDLDFRKARERTPANRADFRPVRVSLVGDVWKYEEIDSMPSSPSPTALKFLHALSNVLVGSTRIVLGRPAADTETWKNECVRLGLIDKASKPDSARALFSKYRRELVVTGRVACDGEWSWPL
jgi:AAA domain